LPVESKAPALEPIEAPEPFEPEPEPIEPGEPELQEPREPGEPSEPLAPRYARLGSEGLGRLRARYAEVLARISDKPMEEPARQELKASAERLNPDAWVTDEEVSVALEQYETVFEQLRGVVGRHPRRRRGKRV